MKTFHWHYDADLEDSDPLEENAHGELMAVDKAVCVHYDTHQVV